MLGGGRLLDDMSHLPRTSLHFVKLKLKIYLFCQLYPDIILYCLSNSGT